MEYTKIPENDAAFLVRTLGLLVNQAGIYGAQHNVTRSATRSVFNQLEQVVNGYGPVEIALKDNQLLVNGSADGLDAVVCKNLFDRMLLHKVGGIVFQAPPEINDFLKCIALFGTPPQGLAAEGGFAAALKTAALRSVRTVTVAYQRVVGDKPPLVPPKEEKKPEEKPSVPQRPSAVAGMSVLDLSAAFGSCADDNAQDNATKAAPGEVEAAYRQRTMKLALLLRETAAVLEQQGVLSEADQHQKVFEALNRIRDSLSESAAVSERQISVFARQVDQDRQTIASIESAAIRRGIGLNLTRGDLVARYAELNQEILQPLTVSSGVIDLLHTGKVGELTESQRDLLKLAADSVERVNQLVAYMGRVSGLPGTFTPDGGIIADSYR